MSADDFRGDPSRNCATADPELFFSTDELVQAAAKLQCRGCPVKAACLTYALDNDERHGVWAGYLMSSLVERKAAMAGRRPAPRRTKTSIAARRASRAEKQAALEQQVRELWERGLSDSVIALNANTHVGAVCKIRKRLGLATLYGARGRRLDREQVNA